MTKELTSDDIEDQDWISKFLIHLHPNYPGVDNG
jgi:hypothetical protein